jgi:molybdopterin converting factor small subunit
MRVSVKLIATYRQLLPPGTKGGCIQVEVAPGSNVAQIISRFGVPLDDSSVIVLNGLTVPLETPLSDGDTVSAFSAIAGGCGCSRTELLSSQRC